MDAAELYRLASDRKREFKSFFRKLKKKNPKDLDPVVQELHHKTFLNIDCLDCANCCKSISPIVTDADIRRIASFLKMKPSAFFDAYLSLDEENDYVFKETPCPFLLEDNYCSIYGVRPKACKEYPHTDRKKFIQLLDLTLKNTFICPAAYKITESLKEKYKLS